MKRSLAIVVVLLLVCGAAWLAWPRPAPPLNVLLITLDTTRADRLGCYGHAKAETPALDSLAAHGLRFSRAYAHAPLTLPSHATILTGLLPPEHGLHDNGRGRLAASVPLLSELLRERGCRTAAFLAAFVLDKQFGLARGFDLYDDRMTPSPTDDNPLDRENPANVVADRALAWLEQNAEKPFFCWVHFYDPHFPYDPPEPFRSRLADPYDGEIAFMDSQIKRLLDFLDARNLRARTLIVVCGDHGESLGEHEEYGHGCLIYNTAMHVPLILSLPGRIPEGKTSDHIAALADVAPTVLDLLGMRRPAGWTGAALRTPEARPDDAVYAESLFLLYSHGWAPPRSITTDRWKYIHCPEPELYDLAADPREENNLAREQPQVAAEMRQRLDSLRSRMRQGRADEIKLDAETVAKLRQLGYLAGSSVATPADVDESKLKDAKAMWPVYNACKNAENLIRDKRIPDAVAALEPMLEKAPDSATLHALLAQCFLLMLDVDRAEPHVKAVLALDPADRAMLANLGTIFIAKTRFADAERLLAEALRVPTDPREQVTPAGVSKIAIKLHVKLGVALLNQKKLDPAAEQFQLALKDDPDNSEANEGIANVFVLQGRNALAIPYFEHVLKIGPDAPNADAVRKSLGFLLCQEKRYADALRVWRDGLKFRPDDPILMGNLAWWMATCPDPGVRNGREAAALAESVCRATDWKNAQALDILAAAYAESGDFKNAADNARKALDLARADPTAAHLADDIDARLKLYLASKPYRQPQ